MTYMILKWFLSAIKWVKSKCIVLDLFRHELFWANYCGDCNRVTLLDKSATNLGLRSQVTKWLTNDTHKNTRSKLRKSKGSGNTPDNKRGRAFFTLRSAGFCLVYCASSLEVRNEYVTWNYLGVNFSYRRDPILNTL